MYLPLLRIMEHPDMTSASVPGFSHNEHFSSLDSPTMPGFPWLAAGHMLHVWHALATCLTCAIYLTMSPITMWLFPTWSRLPVVTAEQSLPSTFLPQGFISALLLAFDHHGFPMGRNPMPSWWLCTALISSQVLSAVSALPTATSTFHFLPVLVLISWLQMVLSDESDSVMCC